MSDRATVPTWRSGFAALLGALNEAGIDDARRQAEWMLMEVLSVGRAALYAHPERALTREQQDALDAMRARRLRHEPIQYILGYTEFFGLRVQVTPAVLIPRPETETVVEHALSLIEGVRSPRLLDVGTGSGCIALALQHRRPDATVVALDVSEAALAVAQRNADALGLGVQFLQADVLDPTFEAPGSFDLILSNPPYVPDGEAATLAPEVRDYEPSTALFSGADPLRFYRAIIQHAPRRLKPEGVLVFETHADYATRVGALLPPPRWSEVTVAQDLASRPRVVSARYTPT